MRAIRVNDEQAETIGLGRALEHLMVLYVFHTNVHIHIMLITPAIFQTNTHTHTHTDKNPHRHSGVKISLSAFDHK